MGGDQIADAASHASMSSMSPLQTFLLIICIAVILFGISGAYMMFLRVRRIKEKEGNLKDYIMNDPQLRDKYLESRKENKKASGKK
jgi:hypothetical protein